MDTLIGIIVKVAEYFVDPIKRQAQLIIDYQSIKEDLRNEHRALSSVLSIVQNHVNQAQNNGEKIIEEVNNWLGEAQSTKDEVNAWLSSIDDLQTKCGRCPNCCKRYNVSKKAMKNKEKITSLVKRGNEFPPVSFPSSPKGIDLISSHGDFTAFDSMKLSFNEVLTALKKDDTRAIGILGMGGIGKTTLVTEISKVVKNEKLFDLVVFVVMSQAPEVKKIQGLLGDMLNVTLSRESDEGRADQLINRMKRINKILVIVDDIWEKIDLPKFGIPFSKNPGSDHKGCKILLTTRRREVCKSMNCQVIQLNLLEEEEAWELFKKNAGGVLNDPSPQLRSVAKKVMDECQRLPLALVVVACALSGETLEEEWQSAADYLKRGTHDETDEVNRCIRLSYDYLKKYDTKQCFLLCSLFPEDHDISVDELAIYAMGFGLCQDVADSITSVRNEVVRMLGVLKSSSLLLNTDNMTAHVKMHDVVRDAAIWITSKDNEPYIVPTTLDSNWAKNENVNQAMAISLLAYPKNELFPVQPQCPRLKILLCAQRVPLNFSGNNFEGLTALRVLDLTAAKKHLKLELPPSLICLQNLRTLLLRRWILEGDISMIGSLKNLEFLSFSACLFGELPIELAELSQLSYLDLSGCKNLTGSCYTEIQGKLPNIKKVTTPNEPPIKLAFDDDDDDDDDDE